MRSEQVSILDGNTFVVCDDAGDIEASPTDTAGLFAWDTRFLSRWVLTVDGERLASLSTDELQYFQSRFFLVAGTGTVYVDSTLSVDPRAHGGRRLPRATHSAQSRRAAGRLDRPVGRRIGLRGSVRGEGCAGQEGQLLDRSRG